MVKEIFKLVGGLRLHSWGECTMPSTQIGCLMLPSTCVSTYTIYYTSQMIYHGGGKPERAMHC